MATGSSRLENFRLIVLPCELLPDHGLQSIIMLNVANRWFLLGEVLHVMLEGMPLMLIHHHQILQL